MGWEQRSNSQYFYKKERDGSKVKSVYVGRGEIAHMVASIQSSSSLIERFARSMKSPEALKQAKAEAELDQLADRICVLTEAVLLAAGFHTHKRQWRKMRNG